LLVGLVGGCLSWSLVMSTPALAACHQFTVTASPTSVSQGGTVTVTVSRDNNLAASNVHVSTVDQTAQAPADYSKLDQNVSFTTEKLRTLHVAIARDSKSDPAETFRLHLSKPGGCTPGHPPYALGPDVTVTITAHTLATPKPAVHTTATRRPVVPTVSSTPSPSLTPSPTAEVTASPETTSSPLAAPTGSKKTGGRSAVAIAGIAVGAVAVISAVGLFFYRRRLV
jgi:hypothetical protein